MPEIIKNRQALIAAGSKCQRKDVLDILEHAIAAAVPYEQTRVLVSLRGDWLCLDGQPVLDTAKGDIYVVGAGKGSFPIAQALDDVMGARIRRGVVVVKEGETRKLAHIETLASSHPLPDARSVAAAQALLGVLAQAGPGDLVLAALTGGSSAMINLPPDGISIKDIGALHDLLLKSGAPIEDMNTVRRHTCRLKGGRLAAAAQPAMAVTLTLDTAPPGMPWPDLTMPDPTTFADAVGVLEKYGIRDAVPPSILRYLTDNVGRDENETLKSLDGLRWLRFDLASPETACRAAADRATMLGYSAHILSSRLEGEAGALGMTMAGICNEIVDYGRPFQQPCAVISGGETTVTFDDETNGQGGPNQETTVGFLTRLRADGPLAFASLDSDGTDGPSIAAGGLVDGYTRDSAARQGVDLIDALRRHDTLPALERLGGLVLTGHTGTNIMNLRVLLVGQPQKVEGACDGG